MGLIFFLCFIDCEQGKIMGVQEKNYRTLFSFVVRESEDLRKFKTRLLSGLFRTCLVVRFFAKKE